MLLQYEIMCDLLVDKMESCMALSIAEAKVVATCYLGGSMFLLLLFDLIDLTCIFGMMQRGAVKLQFVIQIEISRKREFW